MAVPVLAIVVTIGVGVAIVSGVAGVIAAFKNRKPMAAGIGHTRPRPPPAAPRTFVPERERPGLRQRRRDADNNNNSTDPKEPACTVCHKENQKMVEIQPCRHRNVCESCVINKIIRLERRTCPVCRQPMKGYADL